MADKKFSTANITINFSINAADVYVKLELDEDANNGKTSFKFGSTAYFKLYSNASNVLFYTTDGVIGTDASDVEEVKTENLEFILPNLNAVNAKFNVKVSDNSDTLSYEVYNDKITFTHLGGETMAPSLDQDDKTLILANKFGVSLYEASYTTRFDRKTLSGIQMPSGWPEDEEYPVNVVVVAY